MNDADRLDAIFVRIGDLDKHTSASHARIEGSIERIADRVEALNEKVKIQNGRVTKLENQMGDLQVHARIHDKALADADERSDVLGARVWAFVIGSGVAIVAGLLGYFL